MKEVKFKTTKRDCETNCNSNKAHLVSLLITVECNGNIYQLPYCRALISNTLIDSVRFILNDVNNKMLTVTKFQLPSYFIPKHKKLMSNAHNFIDTNIDLYFKSCGDSLPYKLVDYTLMTTERYTIHEVITNLIRNLSVDYVKDYLYLDLKKDIRMVDRNIITYIVKCTTMLIILNNRPLSAEQLQTLYRTLSTVLIESCTRLLVNLDTSQAYRTLVTNIKYITLKSIVSYSNLLFANGAVTDDTLLYSGFDDEYQVDICELVFN